MLLENRESFFKRVTPFFAPSVLMDIEVAYTLAKFSHRSQTRTEKDAEGKPMRYFEHVRRVALVLIDEGKIINREMILAGLLHDGMEDTRDLTPEMIEHCFGADTVSIVKTLSKVPKEGYLDRFFQCTDWRPYILKACDRLDNLRSLGDSKEEFRIRQVTETREKYYPLFEKMVRLTPPEYVQRAQHMKDAILKETERQAVLVGL